MYPTEPRRWARELLPALLLIPDIAQLLGVSRSAARKAVLRGDLGPYVRLNKRRLAVLRDSFLESLRARETGGAR